MNDAHLRQMAFWREHLGTTPNQLELPTDRRRLSVPNSPMHCSRPLPNLVAALNRSADEHQVAAATILIAAYQVLLYRYTQQSEIIVGVEAVALKGLLHEGLTFQELLVQLEHARCQALDGPRAAFEETVHHLVDQLPEKSTPLVRTALQVVTDRRECSRQKPTHDATTLDLGLTVTLEEGGDLFLDAEYNRDLFEASTVARMLSHFEQILREVLSDPSQRVATVPLMTRLERDEVLALSGTIGDHTGPRTLKEIFEQQAARDPAAIAVEDADGTRSLSYAQLDARSNQLARVLRTQYAVGPDVAVGLSAERSIETMVSMLAILKAGGAYVPLSATLPVDRLRGLAVDAELTVILCGQANVSLFESLENVTLCTVRPDDFVDEGLFSNQSPTPLETIHQGDHLAYIIFTSGTSGAQRSDGPERRSGALPGGDEYDRAVESVRPRAANHVADIRLVDL